MQEKYPNNYPTLKKTNLNTNGEYFTKFIFQSVYKKNTHLLCSKVQRFMTKLNKTSLSINFRVVKLKISLFFQLY